MTGLGGSGLFPDQEPDTAKIERVPCPACKGEGWMSLEQLDNVTHEPTPGRPVDLRKATTYRQHRCLTCDGRRSVSTTIAANWKPPEP